MYNKGIGIKVIEQVKAIVRKDAPNSEVFDKSRGRGLWLTMTKDGKFSEYKTSRAGSTRTNTKLR